MRVFHFLILLSAWWISGAQAAPVAPVGHAGELAAWRHGDTPALSLSDLAGQPHRLEDYRGKVVVVNFWATWCEPCRREMPALQRLAQQMPDRVVVLTIDVGETPERIRRFLALTRIDLPVLLDRDNTVAREWKARGLPTSYVIGPDGRIAYYYIGPLEWTSPRVTRVIERLALKKVTAASRRPETLVGAAD